MQLLHLLLLVPFYLIWITLILIIINALFSLDVNQHLNAEMQIHIHCWQRLRDYEITKEREDRAREVKHSEFLEVGFPFFDDLCLYSRQYECNMYNILLRYYH